MGNEQGAALSHMEARLGHRAASVLMLVNEIDGRAVGHFLAELSSFSVRTPLSSIEFITLNDTTNQPLNSRTAPVLHACGPTYRKSRNRWKVIVNA